MFHMSARLWQMAGMSAFCFVFTLCSTTHAQAPKRSPEREYSAWLVLVQFVHRGERPAEDQIHLADIESQIKATTVPAEKRRLQNDRRKLEAETDKRRDHVVYGWRIEADDTGKPVRSTRSMSGFLISDSKANAEAVKAVQESLKRSKPALLVISRLGSRELFTCSGRHWIRSASVTLPTNPDAFGEPHPFHAPPNQSMTASQKKAINTALTFVRSETSDKGLTLHRYIIRIQCDQAPPRTSSLHLWYSTLVEIDGVTLGPILEYVEVPRSAKGGFNMSRSFEFIAQPNVALNSEATRIEPIAIDLK